LNVTLERTVMSCIDGIRYASLENAFRYNSSFIRMYC
jgi:hypothetical protein